MTPNVDQTGRGHLLMALAANAASAAVKLAAFALTGISVLLSEGLHSIADCGNQAALLLGHRGASAPPSALHPLGLGRVRYLWAFLVAVVVFGGGAIGSFVDATYRLLHPEHHPQIGLTLGALALAAVIEVVSFGSLLSDARRARRPGEGWIGFVSRSRDPDLPVLLVEDLADVVGLGLALLATLLADLTGVEAIDAAASYLIGLLLAANAVFLAWQMASLVLGEAPDHEVEQAVLEAVAAVAADAGPLRAAGVQAVHLGPDELLIIVELASGGDPTDDGALGWLARTRDLAAGTTSLGSRVLFDVPAERELQTAVDVAAERSPPPAGPEL
jgi:cation diffusion facilitator family transporter